MAVTAGTNMAWLRKGWDHNQGSSSYIRHYRPPAPCKKRASNNSLLQCNKMSVKAKQADDKARQIRLKYGKQNLEKELGKDVGKIAPFVTKVQIRKTQEKNRLKPAGKKISSERDAGFSRENKKVSKKDDDVSLSRDTAETVTMATESDGAITDKNSCNSNETNWSTRSSVETMSVDMSQDLNETLLYSNEIPQENVERLVRCLSRRLRDPLSSSRVSFPATRPTAAYARPTKGEIALSLKGPVVLTPLASYKGFKAKATAHDTTADICNKLDPRIFQEISGSVGEKFSTRPVSPVSDSVVVTGKQIHSVGRNTWSQSRRLQDGARLHTDRLCHSCRDQETNPDSKKGNERAKSAFTVRRPKTQGSSSSIPPFCFSSTTLHSRNVTNHKSCPKRDNRAVKGLVFPYSLQINLGRLNSYDYGSPVPPPSLSNSDEEDFELG